jgi:Na+/H+-dicarboxylate symporter
MECGEEYGCERSLVQFVIPLGTNINRDGAALYEAVAAIFIFQVPTSQHVITDFIFSSNAIFIILGCR